MAQSVPENGVCSVHVSRHRQHAGGTNTVLLPELLPKVRGCGKGEWSVGIEKDVGGTGCKSLFPAFSPVSEALTDHDIVGIDGNQFAPGYRIPTMLDHANAPRPTRRQQGIGAIRN